MILVKDGSIEEGKETRTVGILREIQSTEEEYVRDLRILKERFKQPLSQYLNSEILENIFVHTDQLLEIHQVFLEQLAKEPLDIKRTIECIDQELLLNPCGLEKPYLEQCTRLPQSMDLLQKQRTKVAEIDQIVHDAESSEECRKLSVGHFLARPFARVMRYVLLFEMLKQEIDQSPKDKDIRSDLNDMIKRWKDMLERLDAAAGSAGQQYSLSKLYYEQLALALNSSQSELAEFCLVKDRLRLLDPSRRLIRQGPAWVSVGNKRPKMRFLFLLDNAFLVTVPWSMSVQKYSYAPAAGLFPLWLGQIHILDTEMEEQQASISIVYMDRTTMDILISFQNAVELVTWRELLATSIQERRSKLISNVHISQSTWGCVARYNLENLAGVCHSHSEHASQIIASEHHIDMYYSTRICTQKARTGWEHGGGIFQLSVPTVVWPDESKSPCISGSAATRVAYFMNKHVIKFHVMPCQCLLFYLLSNKRLGYMVRADRQEPWAAKRKIGTGVSFFELGKIDNRDILVVVKEKMKWSCLIKIYQLFSGSLSRFGVTRILRRIYIGSPVDHLELIRNKLVLSCPFGFELIDPDSLSHQELLDRSQIDGGTNAVLRDPLLASPRRVFTISPGAVYFVCYQKCGFWINERGSRLYQNSICIWHGTPLCFSYHDPFLLIWSERFYEIWNIATVSRRQYSNGVCSLYPSGYHFHSLHASDMVIFSQPRNYDVTLDNPDRKSAAGSLCAQPVPDTAYSLFRIHLFQDQPPIPHC